MAATSNNFNFLKLPDGQWRCNTGGLISCAYLKTATDCPSTSFSFQSRSRDASICAIYARDSGRIGLLLRKNNNLLQVISHAIRQWLFYGQPNIIYSHQQHQQDFAIQLQLTSVTRCQHILRWRIESRWHVNNANFCSSLTRLHDAVLAVPVN